MADDKRVGCSCGKTECGCGADAVYWCETCQRYFPEKRCPQCGLKLKKVR